MKDSIKYGILGLLAVALIANLAYMMMQNKGYSNKSGNISKVQSGDNNKSTNPAAVNAVTNNTDNTANTTTPTNTNSLDPQNQAADAGTSSNLPKTTLSWSEKEHDFGNIQQDSENTHIFTFTNTGNEPLIIEKAKGSCGCTVPEYPKEPIAPGESNEIKVVYKPGKQKNNQAKKVTVTANTDPVQTILTIKANVEVAEAVIE